jgi:hypothetical protein
VDRMMTEASVAPSLGKRPGARPQKKKAPKVCFRGLLLKLKLEKLRRLRKQTGDGKDRPSIQEGTNGKRPGVRLANRYRFVTWF